MAFLGGGALESCIFLDCGKKYSVGIWKIGCAEAEMRSLD